MSDLRYRRSGNFRRAGWLGRAGKGEKLVALSLAAIFLAGVVLIVGGLVTRSTSVATDDAPGGVPASTQASEQNRPNTPAFEPAAGSSRP